MEKKYYKNVSIRIEMSSIDEDLLKKVTQRLVTDLTKNACDITSDEKILVGVINTNIFPNE